MALEIYDFVLFCREATFTIEPVDVVLKSFPLRPVFQRVEFIIGWIVSLNKSQRVFCLLVVNYHNVRMRYVNAYIIRNIFVYGRIVVNEKPGLNLPCVIQISAYFCRIIPVGK